MNYDIKQRGQVLVLIILAIAVIFGFAALAVDIGRVYSERRRAQSAADSAAYAAAFASTQRNDYQAAGLNSVHLNGYGDSDLGPNPDADMDVQIYNPPHSGKYATASETIDPDEYFQVIIRQKLKPVFAQLVYNGPLEFTVEAIARGTASGSFAGGATIVATCDYCCPAVKVHGNGIIEITDGNIISNSNATPTLDKPDCNSSFQTGESCVTLNNGHFYTGGTYKILDKCGDLSGVIEGNTSIRWSGGDPGVPSCANLPEYTKSTFNKDETLMPGIYKNGISISGVNTMIRLNPGFYCLDNDLSVPSGSLIGSGVMFVMRENSSISIKTTKGQISLSPPGLNIDGIPLEGCLQDKGPNGECWSGFLVIMPNSNTGFIHFAGGNSSTYTGTVYAPGPYNTADKDIEAKCSVLGSAETISLNASLICFTVKLGGDGTIKIKYQDNVGAQRPSIVEMTK